jgi:hypothetical protein
MKNMNKSNVLTSVEFINQTLKNIEKIILKNMDTKYTQFRKVRKFIFAPQSKDKKWNNYVMKSICNTIIG